MNTHIGIDVHKDTLEALELANGAAKARKTFKNTPHGRQQLTAWCQARSPQTCALESTGPYSGPVAHALYEAGLPVAVANPRAARDFARLIGSLNKTDRADALVIARYAETMKPRLWTPPPVERQRLTALCRRLDALKDLRTMELNRLEDERLDAFVNRSVRQVVKALDVQIKAFEGEIKTLVARHEDIKSEVALLESIKGIGFVTACAYLAETALAGPFSSAGELCAYAGLTPRRCESGRFVGKTVLSKRGNSRLRKAMYMPAIAAFRFNPAIKAFYLRLRERGKTKMAALAACMKKLLSICYGVLKGKKPFCPQIA